VTGFRTAARTGLRVAAGAAIGLAWAILIGLHSPAMSLAASPDATHEAGGDTRSAGEGPGLVGAPFLAIGGVLALGAATAAVTLVYVRATGGPRTATNARPDHPRRHPDTPAAGGATSVDRAAGEPPAGEPPAGRS
jgi:hypothetical protein